jgi:hypothetical protein
MRSNLEIVQTGDDSFLQGNIPRYFLVGIRTSKNYQHFCHPYGKSEKRNFF